jgi:hypothetical protein
MDEQPDNQSTDPSGGQIYALDNDDFEEVQTLLSLLRQVKIMMWAYRFDHARHIMRMLRRRYFRLLVQSNPALDERQDGPIPLDESTVPDPLDILQEDRIRRDLPIDEQKQLMNQFPLRQRNLYVAISGITSLIVLLSNRLNLNEVATQPDISRFEYGVLKLDDNQITVRTYLFDDIQVTPLQYIQAFQSQSNVNVVFNQQDISTYPLEIRLFSDAYFADVVVFASDYAEIILSVSDEPESVISEVIQSLNATRRAE